MKITSLSLTCVLICGWVHEPSLADGFTPGHLLVTDWDNVYSINPVTGESSVLVNERGAGFGDIVFNPHTNSAYLSERVSFGTRIRELTWSGSNGFQLEDFLTDLDHVAGLAVDSAGDVIFHQPQFVHHRLWRASPNGDAEPLAENPGDFLFTPEFMNYSTDDTELYITTSPNNRLERARMPSGLPVEIVAEGDFPAGVDVAADGTVFFLENGENPRISRVSPAGAKTTYLEEPWMEFLGNGFWGDLEYDDQRTTLYAIKRDVYAIDEQLQTRSLMDGSSTFHGMDLITGAAEMSSFDFDIDGVIGLSDIDVLVQAIVTGDSNPMFDLTGDGNVDQLDLDDWLQGAAKENGLMDGYLFGDANLDGSVNAADLNILGLNWQQSVSRWSGGDFTVDGNVDAGDLNKLALNWQQTISLAAASNTSVPEPAALTVALGLLLLVGVWRRFIV